MSASWGRWGADDQRGAANLITPDAVRRGLAAARTGQTLGLAWPFRAGEASPAVGRAPMQHFMVRDGCDYAGGRPERGGFGFADDFVGLATHGGTHIDALSHVFQDELMYNGHPARAVNSRGAGVCGIEVVGPLVTRGIFVDLVPPGEQSLASGSLVGVERLADAVAGTGVQPLSGDALLIRTGWAEAWRAGDAPGDSWPGLDRDCADWIIEQELALIGADNIAVEAFPSSDPACQVPLHIALLRGHGIYFCELLNLAELAAAGRCEFLLVLAPLPLVGAVGSPVNPVAVL
jgi:kynurenine formamidase